MNAEAANAAVKATILLVDDDDDNNRETMKELLKGGVVLWYCGNNVRGRPPEV
jgi:hypothetical protein